MQRDWRTEIAAAVNGAHPPLGRPNFFSPSDLIIFSAASIRFPTLTLLSSIGIYYCEHDAQPEKFRSVFDAMWWAAVTLTTVGYGDVYPITLGGRIFTVVVLFVALGIIAVPTGLFASALSRVRQKEAAN